MKTRITVTALAVLGLSFAHLAAQEAPHTDLGTLDQKTADQIHKKKAYSPYADRKFPTRPFFGDTHLHTGFSMDAGAFGCRRTPRDAPPSGTPTGTWDSAAARKRWRSPRRYRRSPRSLIR